MAGDLTGSICIILIVFLLLVAGLITACVLGIREEKREEKGSREAKSKKRKVARTLTQKINPKTVVYNKVYDDDIIVPDGQGNNNLAPIYGHQQQPTRKGRSEVDMHYDEIGQEAPFYETLKLAHENSNTGMPRYNELQFKDTAVHYDVGTADSYNHLGEEAPKQPPTMTRIPSEITKELSQRQQILRNSRSLRGKDKTQVTDLEPQYSDQLLAVECVLQPTMPQYATSLSLTG